MNRITLPPTLPPQTAALKRYEETIVKLNHFYWTFKVSLEHILPYMDTVERVTDLILGGSGESLNISSNEFVELTPQTERVARHSLLVLAVTSFEDYLKEVLTTFIVKKWKPDKTYKVHFRPQDLPESNQIRDWLRDRAIQTEVDDLISRTYEGRFDAISKRIIEYGAQQPNLDKTARTLAVLACEARHCIVHSSAIVDARAAKALESMFPGIAEGSALDISEERLWQFLGALRDSARSLDVELRNLM